MKPKISVIVPVFNMENYLSRCLDSLLSQTIEAVEIITINDGSTDRSEQILRNYAQKDSRIVIINQENGGVSSARNRGLEAVRGEYTGFVDPDDWAGCRMYERLLKTASCFNADIVMCAYVREFGTHSKPKMFSTPAMIHYKGEDVQKNIMRRIVGPLNEETATPEMLDAWGTVWSKLYRTTLIKENNISFTSLKKIGTNEDSLFNIKACYYAESFIFLNQHLYHYWRQNDSSVTTGYKDDLDIKWAYLYKEIEGFLKEKNLGEEYFRALDNRISLNVLGLGLNEISSHNGSSSLSKLTRLNHILNNKLIAQAFKHFKLRGLPFKWRTFYFFAKLRFSTGLFIMLTGIEYLRKVSR